MKIAVFPGSFDPVTLGHLNIIKRASLIFDKLVVLVGTNTHKNYWLSKSQRVALIKSNVKGYSNVEVLSEDGLTVNFMKKVHARIIVRGIRNYNDLLFEKSMASMNQNLDSQIETVFLLAQPQYENVSSSIMKEIFKFGGDVSRYVPANVLRILLRAKRND